MIDRGREDDSGVYIGDMRVKVILLHLTISHHRNSHPLKYGPSVLI